MASRRDIRELALQALYELDACGGDASALDLLEAVVPMTEAERADAVELATGAYGRREAADTLATELAPGWPTSRQPAVDRAILRLAHFEMASGRTPHRAAINEAVELAKRYSTERSPAFINGVLDKMMRRLPAAGAAPATEGSGDEGAVGTDAPTSTGDAWLDDALAPPKPGEAGEA